MQNILYNLLRSTTRGCGHLKVQSSFESRIAVTVIDQSRNVRLLKAENCSRFNFCEAATLDDAVDLQSEIGVERLAVGIGETTNRVIHLPAGIRFESDLG